METRSSKRLAAKNDPSMDEEGAREAHGKRDKGDDRGHGRRTSIGGAMGLTPAKPKGRNLVIAKATSVAEAAAARLDELNAEDQQSVGKRTRSSSKECQMVRD